MKFKWHPVKNIDFIIDYYFILELDRFSNDDPKKQFHKLSKQNHPDTVQTASDDIKKLANKKFLLVKEAYSILSKPELKSVYDKQLEKFIKEKPNLISTDGTPIVSLSNETLSLDFLLSGALEFDFQELQKEKSSTLIGFNETTLKALEQIYLTDKTNEQIKAAYLEQLNRQKMVYDWDETFAWQELGVMNPKEVAYQTAEEYLQLIEDKINTVHANLSSLKEARLLSCDQQPLLIGSNIEINHNSPQELAMIEQEMNSKFNDRKNKLIEAAQKKQSLLKKIVKVRTFKQINTVNNKNICVILYNQNEKVVLTFHVDLEISEQVILNTDNNEKDINSVNDLNRNTYLLKHNIELDMAFQLIEFVNDIANNEL